MCVELLRPDFGMDYAQRGLDIDGIGCPVAYCPVATGRYPDLPRAKQL